MGFKLTQEEYQILKTFHEDTGGDIKKTLMEVLGDFCKERSGTKTFLKKREKK